jgi:hypothetical protein
VPLKNIIFSMMIGYFYVFFCFSLCYVLYVIFITFVEKTSVNAQPLSPPIFEKIAPDFKNNVFSYFAYLRLRFLYFFIFSLIFGCPFPPFLAQIGPICGRFWSHVAPEPRDHATQQATITTAWRNARKRSAAPSRARRAGLQLQVPDRFLPGPRIPNPKILSFRFLARILAEPGEVLYLSLPLRQPRTFRRAAQKISRKYLLFSSAG